MKKDKITDNDIDMIINDKLGLKFWEFQLGVGLQYEYYSGSGAFSAPYPKMGKDLWDVFKFELYELLCDKESLATKEWLNDLITGDIRNLVLGICTAITAKYEVTLGIAVPLSALVIKTGVMKYCENIIQKPKKSVAEILKKQKNKFKKNKK